ncbi:hypothetical protein DCAR_0519025 [Daucus carota subsp. sativus]|uniref:Uncharacterized protein n=1 Tax=Daucus carota subsp. sativus TaxID=79200 RepID=A0A161ZYI8_DAUCS|nr:hypothetical protein DCAR_0519025 [Daucus carota subsp. sativus]
MIIPDRKKVKARSSLCQILPENYESSANQNVVGRRRCLGLSASVLEFIKPKCSSRETTNKRPLATPRQQQKVQPILRSVNKPTLQDWIISSPSFNAHFSTLQDRIMSSPSFNAHFSGRVHPAYEEDKVIEVMASNLLPKDGLCLERSRLKDDDVDKQAEEDSSIITKENSSMKTRQSGVKTQKKVSFRLPDLADIFFMDSADGYYYSNKLV